MMMTMMFLLKKLFLLTVPISTVVTTVAMLLPYWWTSETFQVGLWRARSATSSWINVEPQTDTSEGRLLFILQIISFSSIILTDIAALIWFTALMRQNYHRSLASLISLLCLTLLIFFCLSIVVFFVWQSTQTSLESTHLSYSFYLTLFLLLCHTMTLISISLNLAQYRTDHHSIQPSPCPEKISFAFNEPRV